MDSSNQAYDRNPGVVPEDLARLNLVGESRVFRATVQLLRRIAACDAATLIEGETGTGKEVAARAIHYLGHRRECPFIPVNCGALPDGLLESELFGHERGAFTDAKAERVGLITQADGGTLFLDEIEAMSPRAQVVLLRFLQDQKYRPVGGRGVVSVNLRIVAASNAVVADLVDQGRFRRDLLFRLRVLEVRLPPLRERTGDPALLARVFLDRLNRTYQRPPKHLPAESIAWLDSYGWPGNVRELESLILREFLLGDGDEVRPQRTGATTSESHREAAKEPAAEREPLVVGGFKEAKARAVTDFERGYLRQLLAHAGGNISLAARISGKDRSALNRLVRKHGIESNEFRAPNRGAFIDASMKT
jgi:two-component system response regulator GlrR